MSTKVADALHELIRSLTKSEKRYFKLMSSRHTIGDENNYVRLFDYIEKMDEYDENLVHEHFKGEAFLNRFSITKKRLYDHVLSSLDSFHANSDVDAQLYKQLHSADILFSKSLYDQCRRLLRSAEKLASKHQRLEILLLIEDKRRRLIETNGYASVDQLELNEIRTSFTSISNGLEARNLLWSIKSQLFTQLMNKGVARTVEEEMSFASLIEPLAEINNSECKYVENEYLFNHIYSAYYYAINNSEFSLDYLQKNLELIKRKDTEHIFESNRIISVLSNSIFLADRLGRYREATMYLNEMKSLAGTLQSDEDLSIKLFSSINSIEFSLFLRRGDFDAAVKLSEDVIPKLDDHRLKITPARRAFLEFKIAVSYLSKGETAQALKWVNSILNNPDLDRSEDIIGFTLLIDLLVHVELGNDKLLPYSLKSAQRYFKTRNRLYGFEKSFLLAMQKMVRCTSTIQKLDVWEDLKFNLEKDLNHSNERIALEYFDFYSWALAKVNSRSFEMVVKDRYFKTTLKAAS